jgi:hypothetical protein
MNNEGPLLESLTRRMAECPQELLLVPALAVARSGQFNLTAVVCDHFLAMGAPVNAGNAEHFIWKTRALSPNHLKVIAIAVWVLHDEWFLKRRELAPAMWKLISEELPLRADIFKAEEAVKDPDRREELVRVCLKHLDLRPKNESIAQASDRLTTLDSAERQRVMKQTREAEARARKIREQMAAEEAKAAAARYSPE